MVYYVMFNNWLGLPRVDWRQRVPQPGEPVKIGMPSLVSSAKPDIQPVLGGWTSTTGLSCRGNIVTYDKINGGWNLAISNVEH